MVAVSEMVNVFSVYVGSSRSGGGEVIGVAVVDPFGVGCAVAIGVADSSIETV